MGLFPKSHNCAYILVAVNYVSKCVEVLPCRVADAQHAQKMFREIIFPRFGTPRMVISDGGSHFIDMTFRNFLKELGTEHTSQHPTIFRPAVKQKHPISRLRTFCKRPLLRWEGYGGTSCQTLYGPTVVQDSHWYVTLPDRLWENMSPTRRAGAPCTLGYPEMEHEFKTSQIA